MSDVPPTVGELEHELLELVWRDGELTVREALRELNAASGRERAYTTVMTVMGNLSRKGLLKRRREGRTDIYSAAMSREEYARARTRVDVGELLRRYGDVALAHFAREIADLDDERRAELRKLVSDD